MMTSGEQQKRAGTIFPISSTTAPKRVSHYIREEEEELKQGDTPHGTYPAVGQTNKIFSEMHQ